LKEDAKNISEKIYKNKIKSSNIKFTMLKLLKTMPKNEKDKCKKYSKELANKKNNPKRQ
jgi:hypothetical protein